MPKVNAPAALISPGLVTTQPAVILVSTPNAVIPNSDFTIIDRPKRKAVCLVFGDGGTGKTTFGIRHTPQPAVLIGFDGRSEYAEFLQKEAGFPIPSVQIPPPSVLQKTENVKAAAGEAVKKFLRNYDAAIVASKAGKVRTIVIDTGSELGEIITLSVRGTLDSGAAKDFGRSKDQINQIWWKIFGAARWTGDAHLIVLSRASSVWEGNEPTGDFKARVSDTVRDAVDFSLHIKLGTGAPALIGMPNASSGLVTPSGVGGLVSIISNPTRPVAKEFELVVKKGGNNIEELGRVYRQSDWDELGPFVYACTQLMPGSVEADWK